jgi:hypothetical protein
MAKKKPIKMTTEVKDVTDFPGPVSVDVVIGTGAGTKGKWTFGWSYIIGGIVLVYDDGQVISARTPELMVNMTKFRA